MITEWLCRWRLIPGGKEPRKVFPTQEVVKIIPKRTGEIFVADP